MDEPGLDTIMQNNTQPVSVSPLAMTYKAQAVGTKSLPQTVLLTNDEKTSLAISKVALGRNGPGRLQLSSPHARAACCPAPTAP